MARYKFVDISPRLLPVDLEAQLVPGRFAHAVHHLVDALDLSAFDAHYRNDDNGAPAHAPAMLLKAVLLAYSEGIVSSRAIERACRDNVLFIAITGVPDAAYDKSGKSRKHSVFGAPFRPLAERARSSGDAVARAVRSTVCATEQDRRRRSPGDDRNRACD